MNEGISESISVLLRRISFRAAESGRGPHLLTVVATVEYPTWVKQVSDPLLLPPPPPPPLPRLFFLRSLPMAIPPLVTSPADVASPPPPPPPPPEPEPGEQQLQSANRQKCVQLFERENQKRVLPGSQGILSLALRHDWFSRYLTWEHKMI